MLALAGLCGISDSQARSHKIEIKHLKKQRAEKEAEHKEAKERLNELSHRAQAETLVETQRALQFAQPNAIAEEIEQRAWDDIAVSTRGNWASAEKEIRASNWQVKTPALIREREAEAARLHDAAKEMARIDKAIRKQKALERRERKTAA